VGGPEPHMKSNPYLSEEDVNRIGQIILANDPFDHLLSVHNPTGDDSFRQEDWVSYVILQGPKTVDRQKLYKDQIRNSYPNKPLYAQETLWPGNELHSKRIGRDYTNDDIRKNAFTMLFSGSTINFADMDGLSSSGFSGRPDLSLKKQLVHDIIHHVWDTFETFPFYTLSPNQDLVNNGFCLADDTAHRLVVYFDTPGHFSITCEGTYRAEWINPRHPTERKDAGLITSNHTFHTPNGHEDWLLDLIKTGDTVSDQIHLSWSQDPATSLTATWHTESENVSPTLTYRCLSDEWRDVTGETFPSPGSGYLHRATLKDLSTDTSYDYRVSNGPIYRTRTAPGQLSDFTFAFICDTGLIGRLDGNATGTRQIINEVLRDHPTFILGGGDYAYGNKDGRFENMSDTIDTWFLQWQDVLAQHPFMAQYGNHEIHLVERYENWAPRFAHPEGFDENRNYSFDVGNVHFTSIFLPKNNLTEEQLAWINADLETARKKNTPWLFVFQHESIYGHGTSHPARPENRAALAPIFEHHKVDLHLSCHDQNYERTFPLTEVPDNPTPGSTDLHNYSKGKGVIYAKVSPSGKKSEIGHQFSQFTTEQQDFMAVRDSTAHHYALVHVRAAGEITVEVFNVKGDGSSKKLLDTFTISSL
ncbi:MAG: metallophosphoesterase family protein, partial [Candidatus Latescibacteria bacterium]|nr:metallophosphoesterase family protein [Candidatus Latescibacterota bacterium]